MFVDSDIANKLSCAHTIGATIDHVLRPHSIDVAITSTSNIPYLKICTDSSNYGSINMFPVFQYFDASNEIIV